MLLDVAVRSRNNFWRGELSITYSLCVFAALVIHHAIRVRFTVICSLSCSCIFTHYFSIIFSNIIHLLTT